jgi:hypothetical protein
MSKAVKWNVATKGRSILIWAAALGLILMPGIISTGVGLYLIRSAKHTKQKSPTSN